VGVTTVNPACIVQALARLGEAHQQCQRRMEAGLALTTWPVGTLGEVPALAAAPAEAPMSLAPAAAEAALPADSMPSGAHAPAEAAATDATAAAALEEGPSPVQGSREAAAAAVALRPAGMWTLPEEGIEGSEDASGRPLWRVMTRQHIVRQRPGTGASGVRLFVGVLTAGAHGERRAAARETWASDPRLHRHAHARTCPPCMDLECLR
jgi:hypothetical protein